MFTISDLIFMSSTFMIRMNFLAALIRVKTLILSTFFNEYDFELN